MRRQAFRSFTILGLLLVTTAVSVRAQSERKVTNVPFNFIVGQKSLPAGEYTIEPNRRDSDNVWLIQSKDSHVSVLFTTMSVRADETQEKARFVFNKYGDRYFLSQIWTPGSNSGRELLKPRFERELAMNKIERQTIDLAKGSAGRN
jgi:hypothetical protein